MSELPVLVGKGAHYTKVMLWLSYIQNIFKTLRILHYNALGSANGSKTCHSKGNEQKKGIWFQRRSYSAVGLGWVRIRLTNIFMSFSIAAYRVDGGKATAVTMTIGKSRKNRSSDLCHSSREKVLNMYTSFTLPKSSPLKVMCFWIWQLLESKNKLMQCGLPYFRSFSAILCTECMQQDCWTKLEKM